jgi:hypothetical protein
MQVEVIARFEATCQAVWLKNFVADVKVVDNISKSLTLYYDNQATILFLSNNKSIVV